MAWDSARHEAVLVGNDGTWLWNGSRWSQAQPTGPFGPWASVAYDPSRKQVVLFGARFMSQTWTWDGATWTLRHPASSPPSGEEMPMTYDPALGRVVLIDEGIWSWDGQTWALINQTNSPNLAAPGNSALVYDSARSVLVYVVTEPMDPYLFQTWVFDGSTWDQVSVGVGPFARSLTNFIYDKSTQSAILYGGGACVDTWTWDGRSWTELHPATSPPLLTGSGLNPSATYDEDAGLVLLFGGYHNRYLNTMWAWDGITWSQIQ